MRRCRFAQYDETLWLDVLRHYTAKGDECATQIQELLELIEESRALPPLMVVEALASGPDTTLAVCQDYLERQFAEDLASEGFTAVVPDFFRPACLDRVQI